MNDRPDPRIHDLLTKYAEGKISASNAALEIQNRSIPGYDNPSASDVILWCKRGSFAESPPPEEHFTRLPEKAIAPTARERFEEIALKWEQAGRPEISTADPWQTMTIYVWTGSRAARKDGFSETLKAYVQAQRDLLSTQDPEWYDRLLGRPDYCDRCGEYYRLENMSVCTYCGATFAPCHGPDAYWPNGNARCPRCRKGEVVG
jgi:hypothetical protein